jgi:outer membrane protein assembly factor BamB
MRGELLGVKLGSESVESAAVAWRYAESTPDTCCPVVLGDWLFTMSDSGIAQCFDAQTGKLHWKQRIGGNFKASPVAAEGRIYFQNTSGLTTIVAASDRYSKLAENQLDDETLASPAISNGRIYIRGRGHLYAIEKR